MTATPTANAPTFRCPHCEMIAMQRWIAGLHTAVGALADYFIGVCDHCRNPTIWEGERLAYPVASLAPGPNSDLNGDEVVLYGEAAKVLASSPRAAAALLRLLCEKLCIRIIGHEGKLNDLIGELVKDGRVTGELQKALDAVRITGNNMVHPGQIDSDDHQDTATAMFGLINVIAQRLLTEPRQISELYETLPAGPRQAVERRDSASS